ncbi:hypothetical protein [Rhizobium sp. S163]|uniref:hypothetical protein n=1 Tax=Rhizobium sp. S163 TaxID=3055039 RepID=UPI0025A9F613|nr:hypothetical protein [Rhizobium sp. S163]MDM9644362.1 hypothetical protein [Rhizobium sp. S163]
MAIAEQEQMYGRKGATLLSKRSDFGFSADTLGSAGIDPETSVEQETRLQKERQ